MGVTYTIALVHNLILFFSELPQHFVFFEYHVHIWRVSTQLSCSDTCQIWMRFKWYKHYFFKIRKIPNEKKATSPYYPQLLISYQALAWQQTRPFLVYMILSMSTFNTLFFYTLQIAKLHVCLFKQTLAWTVMVKHWQTTYLNTLYV